VRIYCTTTGSVVATDRAITSWLGCDTSEFLGRDLQDLAPASDAVARATLEGLIVAGSESAALGGRGLAAVRAEGVPLTHKYAEPVVVDINIEMAGKDDDKERGLGAFSSLPEEKKTARAAAAAPLTHPPVPPPLPPAPKKPNQNKTGSPTNYVLVARISRPRGGALASTLVADGKGKIVYAMPALAALLETTPSALVGTSVSDLLPRPFSQLHGRWMRDPPVSPPEGSCRACAPVVALTARGRQLPVRLSLKTVAAQDDGRSLHVARLDALSWGEVLQQRRLTVLVDARGRVTGVEGGFSSASGGNGGGGASSAAAACGSLFGFEASALVGKSCSLWLDVLHGLPDSGAADGVDVESVLGALAERAAEARAMAARAAAGGGGVGAADAAGGGKGGKGGAKGKGDNKGSSSQQQQQQRAEAAAAAQRGPTTGWRVGVHAPWEREAIARAMDKGSVQGAVLRAATSAAILTVEPLDASTFVSAAAVTTATGTAAAGGDAKVGGDQAQEQKQEQVGESASAAASSSPPTLGSRRGAVLALHFWRSEGSEGVVEVDRRGRVTRAGCCPLHAASHLLGALPAELSRQRLSKWLPSLPETADGLLDDERRKSALKKPGAPRAGAGGGGGGGGQGQASTRIGPTRHAQGTHPDGRAMAVDVQAVLCEGSDSGNSNSSKPSVVVRLVLRKPVLGDPLLPRQLLGLAPWGAPKEGGGDDAAGGGKGGAKDKGARGGVAVGVGSKTAKSGAAGASRRTSRAALAGKGGDASGSESGSGSGSESGSGSGSESGSGGGSSDGRARGGRRGAAAGVAGAAGAGGGAIAAVRRRPGVSFGVAFGGADDDNGAAASTPRAEARIGGGAAAEPSPLGAAAGGGIPALLPPAGGPDDALQRTLRWVTSDEQPGVGGGGGAGGAGGANPASLPPSPRRDPPPAGLGGGDGASEGGGPQSASEMTSESGMGGGGGGGRGAGGGAGYDDPDRLDARRAAARRRREARRLARLRRMVTDRGARGVFGR
jgi:PAS domain-containing protein